MERTFVGLDVHARSVVACALDDRTGELSKARLEPDNETVLAWLQALAGPVAVVYEAGPTGYGLARFLTGWGVRCVVAAPSKMHRPPGDRVSASVAPPGRGRRPDDQFGCEALRLHGSAVESSHEQLDSAIAHLVHG